MTDTDTKLEVKPGRVARRWCWPSGGRWWIVFQGKGQKTRKVKLHDAAYGSLLAWLTATGRGLGVNKGGAVGGTALNEQRLAGIVPTYH